MLEKIREIISRNPIRSVSGALAVGIILSAGGNILKKDGSVENNIQKVDNVTSIFFQVEPGSLQNLNVINLLPQYRVDDLTKGESVVSVYCQVNGSAGGDIDMGNTVINFTNDVNALKNVEIKIPTPNAEYNGKSGYGYFVICGEKQKDNQYKVNYIKRVVYQVLPEPEQSIDNRRSFSFKNSDTSTSR